MLQRCYCVEPEPQQRLHRVDTTQNSNTRNCCLYYCCDVPHRSRPQHGVLGCPHPQLGSERFGHSREQRGNLLDSEHSGGDGAAGRADGRLPHGVVRPAAHPAARRRPLRAGLGDDRPGAERAHDPGRAAAGRAGHRPGHLARHRLHHRGGAARAARLAHLVRAHARLARHGALLPEGRLPALAPRRLAEHRLRRRARAARAVHHPRVARLAGLQGPARGGARRAAVALQVRAQRGQADGRGGRLHDHQQGERDQAERAAAQQARRRARGQAARPAQAHGLEAHAHPLPLLPLPAVLRHLHHALLRRHLVRGGGRRLRPPRRLHLRGPHALLLLHGQHLPAAPLPPARPLHRLGLRHGRLHGRLGLLHDAHPGGRQERPLGAHRVPAALRLHLDGGHADHPLDDDGRALPHGDPRHGALHQLLDSQHPHVRGGAELQGPVGLPGRLPRGPVVLRGRVDRRGVLRLGAAARDPRQEALGDRGVLPQQLPGLRRRVQGEEAQGQAPGPAEGPGGRAPAAQRAKDRADGLGRSPCLLLPMHQTRAAPSSRIIILQLHQHVSTTYSNGIVYLMKKFHLLILALDRGDSWFTCFVVVCTMCRAHKAVGNFQIAKYLFVKCHTPFL